MKGEPKQRKNPRIIAVGDLETDPFKPGRLEINPFAAGFYDGTSLDVEWGPKCCQWFCKRLKKCSPGTIVYMHNGGNFDFHFLLEFLPVEDCEFMTIGKRIVRIKLPWHVELRDSYAIIPKKLASFAKEEIDYTKFEADVRERHKREILDYLKSDLRNTRKMITGFLERFPESLTLASSVFKRLKNEFDYDPGRSDLVYDHKFRPWFFGGRVEFFRLGFVPGRWEVLDINSAYPWAMAQSHWFGFAAEVSGRVRVKKIKPQSLVMLHACARGCFPFRKKNGIEFPHDERNFLVTGWEFLAAVRLGLVDAMSIQALYTPVEIKSMRDFSETLFKNKAAAKKRGDKEEEYFNKIALNSGYGKLALNVEKFCETKVTRIYDVPAVGKQDDNQTPFALCWHDEDRGLSFWKRPSYKHGIDLPINVATAASITGCVRAYLLESMAKTTATIYVDTDSLICQPGRGLKMGDGLGEWKRELTIDSRKYGFYVNHKKERVRQRSGIWIAGKKLYAAFGQDAAGAWKWKTACKGMRLRPDQIIAIALGKDVTETSLAPTFSFFSKPKFVTREIKRDDRRKK